MVIDKIKVIYMLPNQFPFKDLKEYHNKNGCWFFDDFLKRFEGSYNILDSQSLNLSQMRKINSWQHYYKFGKENEEGTVAFFLYRLKRLDELDGNICCLEFNPQKTTVPDVIQAFLYTHGAYVHRISSMDVAFDLFNVPIQNICFTGHGSTSTLSIGTIGSEATRYLRPNTKDCRIKVYDKEAERRGKPDYNKFIGCTRVEITYQNTEFLLLHLFGTGIQEFSADSAEVYEMFRRDVDISLLASYDNIYKRICKMHSALDNVKIFDKFKGCSAADFGLKQYQLDMFDAYIEKFGFKNLGHLYCNMSNDLRTKFSKYAQYLSSVQLRPLFKGCAIDYFIALSELIKKCIPFPYVNQDDVISFHKFAPVDELPYYTLI